MVFVDVTADWCLTCKVNKLLVIDRDPVAAALAEPGVAPLLADWTNPDPAIADTLRRMAATAYRSTPCTGRGRRTGSCCRSS